MTRQGAVSYLPLQRTGRRSGFTALAAARALPASILPHDTSHTPPVYRVRTS